MSAEMLSLCAWIAEYYVAPLGVVIRSALPAALASPAAPEPIASHQARGRDPRRSAVAPRAREDLRSEPQQRALFELIESIGGPVPVEHLTEQHKFSPAVLRTW